MRSLSFLLLLGCSVAVWAQNSAPQSSPSSQNSSAPDSPASANKPAKPRTSDLAPPRSDRVRASDLGDEEGQSSSKDTQVDLSAPDDDSKRHPESSDALVDAELGSSRGEVGEFHVWDPHRAAKDVEVGDFYFKRKNYRAAEDRYREALVFKDNDATATFRLAVCLDKLDQPEASRKEYENYLKILPHGPQAEEARKAIDRLTNDRLKGPAASANPAK